MPVDSAVGKVADAIREIGREVVLARFRQLGAADVSLKEDQSVLTVADVEAEAALCRAFAAVLPGVPVLGEERFWEEPEAVVGLCRGGDFVVVDPIDGTRCFAAGDDRFGMMASLHRGGELVAAWLHRPSTGEMAVAERGSGTYLDGVRVRLDRAAQIAPVLGAYDPKCLAAADGALLAARAEAARMRRVVNSSHEYLDILRGETDLFVATHITPWDTAPGVLAVNEAGGVAARADGAPYRATGFRGVLVFASGPGTFRGALGGLLSGIGPAERSVFPPGEAVAERERAACGG